jgi:hypothetical protein
VDFPLPNVAAFPINPPRSREIDRRPKTKRKPKTYPETPGPRNCMRLSGNTRACRFGLRVGIAQRAVRHRTSSERVANDFVHYPWARIDQPIPESREKSG